MISVFSYNRILKEQNMIERGCRFQVAKRTEEKLIFTKVFSPDKVLIAGNQNALTDIIYYEVKDRPDIERLKQLRRRESGAMLMLLTATGVSPMQYLKPGISPDMLLLRPFTQEDFDVVNGELLDALLESLDDSDSKESFVLTSRDGRTLFPYSKIWLFEANNKKINLRIGNEEYDFYGSIENLLSVVPKYFRRSHRAYLVNTKKVKKVNITEGLIEMEGGVMVPLSRTYKKDFKRLMI